MCQGFSHFTGVFFQHFVFAKLATSSIRVNPLILVAAKISLTILQNIDAKIFE